ncbi:hypothetical protein LEP1GSC079_1711 [Leptospira interrogans str. FPW1039]|uniref:Uncharacterized protein n=3 Tax=Leptospira interrogans TaxID=173 RepID=A0A0F6IKM1_LEPIR|nr:hypothetical protein [Leptospira interrogans]EMJ38596.1 hypothetical protein LEP1GSC079_1711 [Leptospira interrogans str. FPW1039]
MFQNVFKKNFTIFLFISIFYFHNVFSEAGGLKDRPISVVFVCKPSSQTDKLRYYRSTSLFFKRLKNKRVQENGIAYFVGYDVFSSETPTEQLKLAGENGYDLYIFPKNNLPENSLNDTIPWIGFIEEKKEIEKSEKKMNSQEKLNRKSKTIKSTKSKKRFLNIIKKNISQNSSSTSKSDVLSSNILKTESSKISETQDQSKKENTVSTQKDISKTESKVKNESSQENLVSKNDFSKSDKNPKIKSPKSSRKNKSRKKQSGSTKKDSISTIYNSEKKVEPLVSKEISQKQEIQTTTVNDPAKHNFFELNFDSLKFWFSTNVNLAISLESNPILFFIGEKIPKDLLTRKKEEDTWIQFLDFPQDLRFNDGIYSVGCASAKIPNGISVLHFFFRRDKLIRLKQESFSLNSDGSGKSWELE